MSSYSSKAEQRRELYSISRQYDKCRDMIGALIMDERHSHEAGSERYQELMNLYWLPPIELHHWKAKHSNALRQFSSELIDQIEGLVRCREEVKNTPIVRTDNTMKKVVEAKDTEVKTHIEDLFEKRKQRYIDAIDLCKFFGGLSVSASAHYVMNQHGTIFTRVFYKLHGKVTALQVIIAAAQALENENQES